MKILFAALLLLTSSLSMAEIYKWTDKDGVIHYSDNRPEKNSNAPAPKVETVELSPIQILDNGNVQNKGTEDSGWMAQLLGQAEELKIGILNRIAKLTGSAPAVSNKPSTVEIYTTAWCGACKKAKQWLRENNVPYNEYDIQKNASAALRMRQLGGGGGVPFAIINNEKIYGFNPDMYQDALR
jgi:glutaredoxin